MAVVIVTGWHRYVVVKVWDWNVGRVRGPSRAGRVRCYARDWGSKTGLARLRGQSVELAGWRRDIGWSRATVRRVGGGWGPPEISTCRLKECVLLDQQSHRGEAGGGEELVSAVRACRGLGLPRCYTELKGSCEDAIPAGHARSADDRE